ncbi:MAG: MHYT domain-containing protein [Beijerinckiaceae bacterium]
MLRVYACLTGQHDLQLVLLAILICFAACSTSVKLFVHANKEKDHALPWLFGAATAFGGGAWATQVIAEFAYEPGLRTSYGAGLTLVSLLAAIAIAWLGMFVAHRYAAPALGGGIIGAGIAAMHYIGMAALRAAAHQHLDLFYVLASVAIGMTAAAAAMRVLSRKPALRGRLAAVALLVLAIAGLHFTGMAALALVPDPLIAVPGHAIAPIILILAISTVVVVIAGFCSLGALDAYLALRTAREAERLRRSEDHLARAEKNAHIGSIVQDLRTGVIAWSGETYRLFGLDPNLPAPVGEAFLALFHPDDRAAWVTTQWLAHQAATAGTLREMPGVSSKFRIIQAGGAVRQVQHESELILDQCGVPVRWVGTYRDVTEAYEAEESLKLAFEENPGPIWLFDSETLKFLGVNKAAIAHYGYDRESFL